MAVRELSRLAVDASLRVARLPLSGAARITRRGAARSGAELAVDRADATVRGLVGRVLGDEGLREDAQRRHAAADELERAARLRQTAQEVRTEADAELAETQDEADRKRQAAQRRAEERKEQAAKERKRTTSQAEQAERRRKDAARKAKQREREAAQEREREERLEQLDDQAEALDERKDALRTEDEAARLKDAAARAKRERKKSSV